MGIARFRGEVFSKAGESSQGGMTQTKNTPEKPGRFKLSRRFDMCGSLPGGKGFRFLLY
jgi:hypothetical protein